MDWNVCSRVQKLLMAWHVFTVPSWNAVNLTDRPQRYLEWAIVITRQLCCTERP